MKKNKYSENLSSQSASINDLILFCIYSVSEKRDKCNFERLVGECFKLFPEHFGFPKYPQWPDARKLDRPLRALRNKKIISGDPQSFFVLTKKGKKIVQGIANSFRQKKLFL